MIKCEISENGTIEYNGEQPHLVFYIHTERGQQYVFADPWKYGDKFVDPIPVQHLHARGYEIKEVYAIEPADVSILRGIYAQRVT